jgi:mechanosensitive ion channel-like protein
LIFVCPSDTWPVWVATRFGNALLTGRAPFHDIQFNTLQEGFKMLYTAAVEVADSLQRGLDEFIGFLPRLVGFLVILLIGWLIARAVKALIVKALHGVGIDRALAGGSAGPYVARVMPDARPSELIGAIAFWFIFLGAIAIAVSQLGIAALDNFVQSIAAYLPNIVVAILIFVLAGAIAAAVSGLVDRTLGDTATGKIAGAGAPILIMGIATFMILDQLNIAPAIVEITYVALLGSVALGMAIAFGLGGRDVAARLLEDAYREGQARRGEVRAQRDMPARGYGGDAAAPSSTTRT